MDLRFKDSLEMARKLPYFGINKEGKPYLKLDLKIIDAHTHLGFFYFISKPIDYLKATEFTKYEFPEKDIQVDLSLYSGVNLTRHSKRRKLFFEMASTLISSKGHNSTQTIPNLLEEMSRYNIEKSVILPIDLPLGSKVTKAYLKHVDHSDKLVFFCFVHPIHVRWRKRMENYVKKGARGLKIHPYTMMAAPDRRRIMKLIREWSKYDLPILFHTGYSGIEPKFTRKWVSIMHYEKPIKEFPKQKFILGHSGAAFHKRAIGLARKYPNVYLELSGQPPEHVKQIIESVDNSKIIYGSDWPFFPSAIPIAKVLLGTEDKKKLREDIFYNNSAKLLKLKDNKK